MAVFQGDIRTPRAVADPGTDHLLPPSGALSYGAIPSQSALAGTHGVDVALVQGNKWLELNGNFTEHIHGNLTRIVFGNHRHKTVGDLDYTIVGNTADKRIGQQVHTNIAPRHDIFCHTRTETHHQPECQQQPTARNDVGASGFWDWKNIFQTSAFTFTITGVGLNLYAAYARAAVLYVQDNGFIFSNSLTKQEFSGLKAHIGAMGTDIRGARLHVALAKLAAVPIKILAGMSFKWNTPWS